MRISAKLSTNRVIRPGISTDIRPQWERDDFTNIRLLFAGQSPPVMPSRARCDGQSFPPLQPGQLPFDGDQHYGGDRGVLSLGVAAEPIVEGIGDIFYVEVCHELNLA